MSKKSTYTCNICNKIIKNMSECVGIKFSDLTEFTLGGYDCTEGTHICYSCIRQLKILLAKIDIDFFSE